MLFSGIFLLFQSWMFMLNMVKASENAVMSRPSSMNITSSHCEEAAMKLKRNFNKKNLLVDSSHHFLFLKLSFEILNLV